MSALGYVTRQNDGSYTGSLTTASFSAPINIVPNKSKSHGKQPDFRVYAGRAELGAGWTRKGKTSGQDYVSLRLAAPELGDRRIYVNLGVAAGQDDPDVHALIWNQ